MTLLNAENVSKRKRKRNDCHRHMTICNTYLFDVQFVNIIIPATQFQTFFFLLTSSSSFLHERWRRKCCKIFTPIINKIKEYNDNTILTQFVIYNLTHNLKIFVSVKIVRQGFNVCYFTSIQFA